MEDLWVFGYGSLMWRPGFPFISRQRALVSGWRRRLCVYSHVYRGTREQPGLVLGLDEGGECAGVAFRVEAAFRDPTIRYLRDRELVTDVYIERMAPIELDSGQSVMALTFVADRNHSQYAGKISPERLLALVKHSSGISGANSDYVINTYEHLMEMGIVDRELEWLVGQLRKDQSAA